MPWYPKTTAKSCHWQRFSGSLLPLRKKKEFAMARTKRKVKYRAKAHIKHVKSEHKKRIRAAGGNRTAQTRSRRRARRLAAKANRG
jgi:hypothetical protein